MGGSSSSEKKTKEEGEATQAKRLADREQKRKDQEEQDLRAEQERQQQEKQKKEDQEKSDAQQQRENELRMELQQQKIDEQRAKQDEEDRLREEWNEQVEGIKEYYEKLMEQLKKDLHKDLENKQRSVNMELQLKRNEFTSAEKELEVDYCEKYNMRKQAEEEHRSEIERHELMKREVIAKHQDYILKEMLSTAALQEGIQEQLLKYQAYHEKIEVKAQLDRGNLDIAIQQDMLEIHCNYIIRQAKSAKCSFIDAMNIVTESKNSLKNRNGKKSRNVRNGHIGLNHVKHEMYSLTEAAEDILRLKRLYDQDHESNKRVAEEIINKLIIATDSLNQFENVLKDKKILKKTFEPFNCAIYSLITYINFLVEIELRNHAAGVIEQSNSDLQRFMTKL